MKGMNFVQALILSNFTHSIVEVTIYVFSNNRINTYSSKFVFSIRGQPIWDLW
jgi:hypothetical protein